MSKWVFWWVYDLLKAGFSAGELKVRKNCVIRKSYTSAHEYAHTCAHSFKQEDVGASASFDRPRQVASNFNLLWSCQYSSASPVGRKSSRQKRPRLLSALTMVLHDANWITFWGSGLVLLIASLANFVVPLSLNLLLDCITAIDSEEHDGAYYSLFSIPYGQVYALVFLLFSASAVKSICMHQVRIWGHKGRRCYAESSSITPNSLHATVLDDRHTVRHALSKCSHGSGLRLGNHLGRP